MPTQTAFLSRGLRVLAILLCVHLLVSFTDALPPGGAGGGGGGGHGGGGGGHFGGHSGGGSGSKSGGHFGWLHLGHSNRNGRFGASSMADSSPFRSSSLWSSIAFSRSFSAPPTLLLTRPTVGVGGRSFTGSLNSFSGRPRGALYFRHFAHRRSGRYPSSGCFFDGATQVCFYAPLLPFCGFADAFYFGGGFGGAWIDSGYSAGDISEEEGQSEMDTIPPESDSSDRASEGNDSTQAGGLAGNSVGKDQFMLVLKNGVRYAVSDYWVADGYLEYTISDGTRSQVPLESLDVEATVAQNAPRGLPLVLRSAPGH
jgi:hypothetical protein